MRYRIIILTATVCLLGLHGCSKAPADQGKEPQDPPTETPEEKPEDKPADKWTEGYPDGVILESFEDDMGGGEKCLGSYAIIDFSANSNLRFNVVKVSGKKTLTDICSNLPKSKGKAVTAINGGYFAGSTSVSLAIVDSWVETHNIMKMNWPNDENAQNTVYPVRSALGFHKDGHFDVQWVYCVRPDAREYFAFPSALDNNEKTQTFMPAGPTEETEGGVLWSPTDAIGGGPRLVQNGKDVAVTNYWAEVFDAGGTAGLTRQPRTAIGVTEDNRLILLVCDGRKMRGSCGMTLSELAAKMISLGAVDAMNLDGGGSSTFVGKDLTVLNRPSDSGTEGDIVQRKIPTAVVISAL